jgi:hypothetical protein
MGYGTFQKSNIRHVNIIFNIEFYTNTAKLFKNIDFGGKIILICRIEDLNWYGIAL